MVQYTKQFQDYWALTAKQLSLDEDTTQNFYASLYGAYSEVQRHYHSIQHIVECLEHFHQIKTHLDDTLSVELAIWFHDVIYNPKAHDNEQQSADYLKRAAKAVSEDAPADWLFGYRVTVASNKHVQGFPSKLSQTVLPLWQISKTK